MARWLAALLLVLAAPGARAHDTWFERLPASAPGEQRLALGTGTRFPVHEVSVGAASLVTAQCRGADGRSVALRPRRDDARALRLGVRVAPGTALTCYAQQATQELTLAPALIDVYLDEIRAPAAVRQRRAALAPRLTIAPSLIAVARCAGPHIALHAPRAKPCHGGWQAPGEGRPQPRGSRGRPSPRSAIRLRWIWLVPP